MSFDISDDAIADLLVEQLRKPANDFKNDVSIFHLCLLLENSNQNRSVGKHIEYLSHIAAASRPTAEVVLRLVHVCRLLGKDPKSVLLTILAIFSTMISMRDQSAYSMI